MPRYQNLHVVTHVYAYIQHTELAHLQQCVLFTAIMVTVYTPLTLKPIQSRKPD